MAGHQPVNTNVIRNVGTGGGDDVVRSLMFSIHVLGVREVIIIGRTAEDGNVATEEGFEDHIHKQCGVWAVSPSKFYCYSENRRNERLKR